MSSTCLPLFLAQIFLFGASFFCLNMSSFNHILHNKNIISSNSKHYKFVSLLLLSPASSSSSKASSSSSPVLRGYFSQKLHVRLLSGCLWLPPSPHYLLVLPLTPSHVVTFAFIIIVIIILHHHTPPTHIYTQRKLKKRRKKSNLYSSNIIDISCEDKEKIIHAKKLYNQPSNEWMNERRA